MQKEAGGIRVVGRHSRTDKALCGGVHILDAAPRLDLNRQLNQSLIAQVDLDDDGGRGRAGALDSGLRRAASPDEYREGSAGGAEEADGADQRPAVGGALPRVGCTGGGVGGGGDC